jgi:hypothetical protein
MCMDSAQIYPLQPLCCCVTCANTPAARIHNKDVLQHLHAPEDLQVYTHSKGFWCSDLLQPLLLLKAHRQ